MSGDTNIFQGTYAEARQAPLIVPGTCVAPLTCNCAQCQIEGQYQQDSVFATALPILRTQEPPVPNSDEILSEHGLHVLENAGNLLVQDSTGTCLQIPPEALEALITKLRSLKRLTELKQPGTLAEALNKLKQRAGPELAPLVDLLQEVLKPLPRTGSEPDPVTTPRE